jgi:hypothetical protein
MADDIIGSVAVEVVPSAKNFVRDFKAQVLPKAGPAGKDFGDAFGTAAGQVAGGRLRSGIIDGLKSADVRTQGAKQGDEYGGAFDRTVKARLNAALRNLPKIKIDGDTADADKKLAELRARIEELSGKNIGVDITDKEALAKLAALRAELDAFAKDSTNIKMNVDARSASNELGKVKAELEDVFRAGSGLASDGASAAGSGGPGSGLLIGGAIVAGLSLVGPASAAAVAGLGAVAGAGGVAYLAFKGIQNEIKAGTSEGKAFQAQFATIKGTVSDLEATAAHGVQGGVLSALSQFNKFAPQLDPLIASISGHLGQAGSITAGALIQALKTMSPLLEDGGRYAEVLAQKLADFAGSNQFKDFVAYARQELPALGHDVADVGKALLDWSVALQPVGDGLLKVLDTAFKVEDLLFKVKGLSGGIDLGAASGARGTGKTTTPYHSGGAKPDTLHQINDAVVNGAVGLLTGNTGPSPTQLQNQVKAKHAAAVQAQLDAQNQANANIALAATQDQAAVNASSAGQATLAFMTANQSATAAIQQQAIALQATTRQMYLESDAGGLLKQQLDALSGKQLSAAQAQNQFEQALVNMVKHTSAADAAVTGLSSSAIKNRGDLLNLVQSAESTAEAYGSLDKSGTATRQKLIDLRQQIIDNAVASGENKAAVTAYIDSVLKIPASVVTKVDVDKARADAKLELLKITMGNLHGTTLTIGANTSSAIANINSVVEYVNSQTAYIHVATINPATGIGSGGRQALDTGPVKHATGGYIAGPGSGTSDSILARLSNGEYVVNAAATAQHRDLLDQINSSVQRYATGGLVTITPPVKHTKAGGRSASSAARAAASHAATVAKAATALAAAQANIRFTTSLDLSNLNSSATSSAISSAIRKLITDVHAATAKGVGSDSLIPTLQAENSRLGALANQRASIAAKLRTASANLTSLRAAYTAESDKVASSVAGNFNITSLASPTFFGTASPAAFVQNLQIEAQQVTTAAAQLGQLRKLGLNKDLITQLGEAGPGGFAATQSLASATSGQIAQINALYASVHASSVAAGNQVAGSLYQAGIDSATGYIRGLNSQLASVNKAASALAATVVRQIKKDLGIRSPSQVLRQHGRFTAEGFALGIADRQHLVSTSARGLANAAVQPAHFHRSVAGGAPLIGSLVMQPGVEPESFAADVSRTLARRLR